MKERNSETQCPGCGSNNTVLKFEAVYKVGSAEPETYIGSGAQCEECGLRYVTEDVKAELLEKQKGMGP